MPPVIPVIPQTTNHIQQSLAAVWQNHIREYQKSGNIYEEENKMGEVIVVTSGKGGVGKTTTVANIGTGLAMLFNKIKKPHVRSFKI